MAHDIFLFQKAFSNHVWLNKLINSLCVLGERAYFAENYHQLSRSAGIILSWNLRHSTAHFSSIILPQPLCQWSLGLVY